MFFFCGEISPDKALFCINTSACFSGEMGMVGWCEGVEYHTSSGDQLILAYSWAMPASLAAGKGRGGMFSFLLFLHCHSFSFLPCPSFSSLLLSFLSLYSLFLWELTQNDLQGLTSS